MRRNIDDMDEYGRSSAREESRLSPEEFKKQCELNRRAIQRQNDDKNLKKDGYVLSGMSGIGYRDYTLGSTRPIKSRMELDSIAYAHQLVDSDDASADIVVLGEVPSLTSMLVKIVAKRWGDHGMFNSLNSAVHQHYAAEIMDIITERTASRVTPFRVWASFADVLSSDMPKPQRTYRGLCISDKDELQSLNQANERSVLEWQVNWDEKARELALSKQISAPCFFLSILDLVDCTAFSDSDVITLKNPLSRFLAVLKLRGTSVTDYGVTWIARAHGQDDGENYRHLQVLSLGGLKKVTDDSVKRLARLSLRLLDIRGTACTREVRYHLNQSILSQGAKRVWQVARPRPELERRKLSPTLELELYSSHNFSSSRILAYLHLLGEIQERPSSQHGLTKSVCVHIEPLPRTASFSSPQGSEPKTKDELYHAQISLVTERKQAAYSSTYGTVTSTFGISSEAFSASSDAQKNKGAAYRPRDDSVANGTYIGPPQQHVPGKISLYEASIRKHAVPGSDKAQLAPLSDSETEAEEIREWDRMEEKRMNDINLAQQQLMHFYQPVALQARPRPARQAVAPPQSQFKLIRHLPVRPAVAFEPLCSSSPSQSNEMPSSDGAYSIEEGSTIRAKRRKTNGTNDAFLPFAKAVDQSPSSTQSTVTSTQAAASDAGAPISLKRVVDRSGSIHCAVRTPIATPTSSSSQIPASKNPFAKSSSRNNEDDDDAPFVLARPKTSSSRILSSTTTAKAPKNSSVVVRKELSALSKGGQAKLSFWKDGFKPK